MIFASPFENNGTPFCQGTGTCKLFRTEEVYVSATYEADSLIRAFGPIMAGTNVILSSRFLDIFGLAGREFEVEDNATLEVFSQSCVSTR